MISEANLNAIEFGILRPQICIRDMRPPHSYIPASVRLRGQVNTSAAPYREVEVRGITSGEIPIGPHAAAGRAQCKAARPKRRLSSIAELLGPTLFHANYAALTVETPDLVKLHIRNTLSPSGANVMLNGLPDEDSSAHKLRFSKRISIFFASGTGGPNAEIPVAIVGGRLLANRIALQEKDHRHNHRGTESCQYSHAKKERLCRS